MYTEENLALQFFKNRDIDTCLCFGGGSCSRQQANDGGAASESVYRLNGLSHLRGQPGAVILFYHPMAPCL